MIAIILLLVVVVALAVAQPVAAGILAIGLIGAAVTRHTYRRKPAPPQAKPTAPPRSLERWRAEQAAWDELNAIERAHGLPSSSPRRPGA